MNNTEQMRTTSENYEPTEAEKVLGSMPENPVHDIYDDSYWERRNPEGISVDDYAKLMGIEVEDCVEACKEAIYNESGHSIVKKEGTYWLIGSPEQTMEGKEIAFHGNVWAFPNDSKARFEIQGTYTHVDYLQGGKLSTGERFQK